LKLAPGSTYYALRSSVAGRLRVHARRQRVEGQASRSPLVEVRGSTCVAGRPNLHLATGKWEIEKTDAKIPDHTPRPLFLYTSSCVSRCLTKSLCHSVRRTEVEHSFGQVGQHRLYRRARLRSGVRSTVRTYSPGEHAALRPWLQTRLRPRAEGGRRPGGV